MDSFSVALASTLAGGDGGGLPTGRDETAVSDDLGISYFAVGVGELLVERERDCDIWRDRASGRSGMGAVR